jgi:hypothetical protein
VPDGLRRLLDLSILLVTSAAYLAYVFRFAEGTFWTTGAGDWIDPYFINALLEHWYRSVASLADPASPPMYFPARKTLGYSHGLVLYAPFYIVCRLFLHPFQAYNLTLLIVIAVGIVCLYLLFRKFFRLSFIEALLLTAFFFSSRNVINGGTGVWAQRASVFLIPPVLYILCASLRVSGRAQLALAALAGFLATLLFTQDFYTAQFASLFVVLVLPAALLIERETRWRMASLWNGDTRPGVRAALVVMVLATLWMCYVLVYGGGTIQILGVRIRSHDWLRPAVAALAALAVFLGMRGGIHLDAEVRSVTPWLLAFSTGAIAGIAVFIWIYLGAYREHRVFPEEHLLSMLITRDPSRWESPTDLVRALNGYDSARTFILVFVLAVLAWIPRFGVEKDGRRYFLWLGAVSLIVLLIPLTFNERSLWRTVFEPLPGFSVIRDPKRIIQLYELTATLLIAFILARVRARSAFRLVAGASVCFLLIAAPNPERFDFLRPIHDFARWVEAPIDKDPSCQSFFIRRGSAAYRARSDNSWSLYSIDAFFVALNHSLPTLNGYSAWSPPGWSGTDPENPYYPEEIQRWVHSQGLTDVCELDMDARTLRPAKP